MDESKGALKYKRQSLRNALLITVSGDRKRAAIWHLDKCEVGGQTIRMQAIPTWMTCNDETRRRGQEQWLQQHCLA